MPRRKEVIVRIEMTPIQRQICKALLGDSLGLLASASDDKGQVK